LYHFVERCIKRGFSNLSVLLKVIQFFQHFNTSAFLVDGCNEANTIRSKTKKKVFRQVRRVRLLRQVRQVRQVRHLEVKPKKKVLRQVRRVRLLRLLRL
jgi:hypothetical protein